MTITLRPEDEELIAQAIETGAYQSPDDVIRRALEMLHSEDAWLHEHKAEIAEKIERAFAQFERGESPRTSQGPKWRSAKRRGWLNNSADGAALRDFRRGPE